MKKGDVLFSDSRCYQEGDVIEVWQAKGPKWPYRVIRIFGGSMTITGPSRWERLWFYIKHPRWWKFALDIPFNPQYPINP